MIQRISYGDKLDKVVEQENLIPYRLHRNSRYRKNCYYWSDFERTWFKVEEVEYDFMKTPPELDHVIVTYEEGNRSWICTDLSMYDFRLERDKYNIANQTIINSENSFAGGEIEFWLFKHHVNFIQKKWRGFQRYFDPNSEDRVDPSKFYFVKANKNSHGVYTHIEFVLDPNNEKFYKTNERNLIADESYTIKIDRKAILKERRRRQRNHESKAKAKS